ncbi:MAG: aminotransferase class I/II-fold pyridoxal phosphate-dependent enzyme [Rhodopseudomonas palustris]|nr:aminotransferase class I/II-fold pyridoxal phosphate-dependent enzyme [Rhodopseudomonas palustris]
MANGATPVGGPETRPHHRRRCDPRRGDAAHASVVCLANPNNPTGTYIAVRRGEAPARGPARRTCVLVLDAAYAEYVPTQRLRGRASSWSSTTDNTVMTRTFSKIYGLAALRHRLVLTARPNVVDALNRIARSVQRLGPGHRGGRRGHGRPSARRSSAVAHNEQLAALA